MPSSTRGRKKIVKGYSEQHTLWSIMPFRIHVNDRIVFKKLLEDADIKFQDFVTACMEAFIRADPSALKIVKDWRDLSLLPKRMADKYVLSHRERNDIAEELYKIQKKEEGDK